MNIGHIFAQHSAQNLRMLSFSFDWWHTCILFCVQIRAVHIMAQVLNTIFRQHNTNNNFVLYFYAPWRCGVHFTLKVKGWVLFTGICPNPGITVFVHGGGGVLHIIMICVHHKSTTEPTIKGQEGKCYSTLWALKLLPDSTQFGQKMHHLCMGQPISWVLCTRVCPHQCIYSIPHIFLPISGCGYNPMSVSLHGVFLLSHALY